MVGAVLVAAMLRHTTYFHAGIVSRHLNLTFLVCFLKILWARGCSWKSSQFSDIRHP